MFLLEKHRFGTYGSTQWLVFAGLLSSLLLAGCQGPAPRSTQQSDSGPPRIPAGVLSQPDPVPRDEPLSASGNSLSYVVYGKRYYRLDSARGFDQTGVASWYGRKFHGRLTASGEPYDMYSMTAAHKSLPLPTFARVTNLLNNRSIVVRVNDRGPFVDDRLIDLSYAAAAKLDMLGAGTARVRVVALSGVPGEAPAAPPIQVAQELIAEPSVASSASAADPRIVALSTTVPKPQTTAASQAEPAPAAVATLSGPSQTQPSPAGEATAVPAQLALLQSHYLQLGAFGSFEAASALRTRVADLVGFDVFIAKQSDSELYRVQAGPFASAGQQGSARESLRLEHSIDAIPVQLSEPGTTCC